MSNLFALFFTLVGFVLCFLVGKWDREKDLLEDMKGVLRKNKEAAIRADAHLITDKRNLDQVSYDIGYFQGRDACFMEILDLIDKKTRKEVERNRDRRKSKQNR